MSKKKRDQFDERVSRILLFLLGGAFLNVSGYIIWDNLGDLSPLTLAFSSGFSLFGLPLVLVSIFSRKSIAMKWAENTGNHEVLIVFILLAYGIAAITKSKNA